jgi:hypothetical protein
MEIGNENVVGNGTYKTNNGVVHKYICNTCSKSFTSNANTVLYDLKTDEGDCFFSFENDFKRYEYYSYSRKFRC